MKSETLFCAVTAKRPQNRAILDVECSGELMSLCRFCTMKNNPVVPPYTALFGGQFYTKVT
jgi:hypothetical protein